MGARSSHPAHLRFRHSPAEEKTRSTYDWAAIRETFHLQARGLLSR